MKRTGVIVGIGDARTMAEHQQIAEMLQERFPGVRFGIVPGSAAVTFDYDDGEVPPPPPPPPPNRPTTTQRGRK